ncbi:chaperone modulator CbpM [Robiginitalea aurantiaca]|uniref:Chaperone modulator CbpM n=1 Tax=Robiginitalea aurantiaca TaxID=3056915 RepID=A0ABT7WCT7_9FLAO|nr:chaperone modulator CbpM [Robiginitalea aurantiaca]MDM9630719.1 chaperone modulator CbpM [Robiginitalea aurantiaca]
MNVKKYIRITDFCKGHALEESFLVSLHEIELIDIREVESERVIPKRDLRRLERLVRLHRDLEISPQGLLAVDHLLNRMEVLQEEVLELRRRLNRWE